ncbi:MAG: hybrid sensor histidine kinase/response regulator, partial [Brevundimonas sp.]
MAEPRRFGSLSTVLMAAGLVVTVAALAYPAFRANPITTPGLMLILTVGVVALVGLFGFGRAERPRSGSDAAVDLLDAMAEPAAVVWASGQILAFNAAWSTANGAAQALPKAKAGA